ncbi:membrane-bound acylglycerophosphatidylinositol O-acyltransferase frj-like [Arctopsyche grandis]|uniref:membrane-bound acylglycerophosphatidylinositol O-acyltransferase frj-like n=1 Tax=Arctopsyche grandis TaxID=121162 RepID=UPI00406D7506
MHPHVLRTIMDHIREDRDIIYFGLIATCLAFSGLVQKNIQSVEAKKWSGTCLGLFLIFVVMGNHVWHFILATIVGSFLSVYTDKRRCHIIVFGYMITYLTVLRLWIMSEDRNLYVHIALMTMLLTCKLAGVAFEISNYEKRNDSDYREPYPEEDVDEISPTFSDILHYAFSYFGMLVGPYVRYRTYDDFLKLPFAQCSNSIEFLKTKLPYMPIYFTFYVIFEIIWPLEYVMTEEFGLRSFSYKFTYAVLQFQRFKLWMYIGLTMSECICGAAGFGAYPVQAKSESTHGPTKSYKDLKKISCKEATKMTYDFKAISNIDVYRVQTNPWLSVYNRSWNKSIQYFMAMYIFRSLPRNTFMKPLRPFITIMVCAFWHGIELGYQIGMAFLPLYTPTERRFILICENLSPRNSNLLKAVMYVTHLYIGGFGIMSFLLLDVSRIYVYYSSLLFLPFGILGCIHILGLLLVSNLKLTSNNNHVR